MTPSAEEQAVAYITQNLLQRFDEIYDNSDDELVERSDPEMDQPSDSEPIGPGTSQIAHHIVPLMVTLIFLVEDGADDSQEQPRKRARTQDHEQTSRQWYPWPDKIVSAINDI